MDMMAGPNELHEEGKDLLDEQGGGNVVCRVPEANGWGWTITSSTATCSSISR